ncbi:MAG: 6-O-methylguanine DNA methyltransferase [Candidatus Tokpelaia sp. JSC189]|nr:MAG: 6-O-methylguanine DNA methyltransferase [Candidatus Tokpelaia sp. JSC189]
MDKIQLKITCDETTWELQPFLACKNMSEALSLNRKNYTFLKAERLETPIGDMLAVADENNLHFLGFCDQTLLPDELKRLQKKTDSFIIHGRISIIDEIERELDAYFTGISALFKTPLALDAPLFTRKAWETLRQIPPGETRSYKQQACHVGNQKATRAVAQANRHNRIAIAVPCHRVIGIDGTLTGYSGGIERKEWLLNHEKHYFRM